MFSFYFNAAPKLLGRMALSHRLGGFKKPQDLTIKQPLMLQNFQK